MSSQIHYTSTLPDSLMQWLTSFSKEKKMPKKRIIVEALELYKVEQRKRSMAADFQKAAKDPEMLWFAEAGLGDFKKQLDYLESHGTV